jgi:glycosyltransferase involved in cell wall biosynthesis
VLKPNILYVSYDGMTDPLGQSQVLPYLCGLASNGYSIHLISAEKPENFKILEKHISSICSANNIIWHPLSYTKKPPVLSTILDIYKMHQLARKLQKHYHFNLIHCRSYIAGLVGIKIKKEFSIPFLFDMRGLWVDEKVDGNIWNLKNPVYRYIYNYFKGREKDLFGNSDAIISLTNKACPVIKGLNPNTTNPPMIQVIPCCVDTDHFNPALILASDADNWRKKIGLKTSDFILAYLGSFSTWYLPLEMIAFFKRLSLIKPESKFLVITHESPELFRTMATTCGVDSCKLIITKSNRSELPALLSLADISISFIKPAYSKIASSPTKIGELLSMGIPVVCNKGIGDTDEIILNSGTGVICSSNDNEAYDQLIHQILKLKTNTSPEKIREKAIELFSLKKGVSHYLSVYKKLLHQE